MEIYKLEVVILPTNVPCIRIDHDDEVYRTEAEKFQAILKLLQECQARQQPVLVGTVSIEKSEKLSAFLKKHQIPHQVLNARYHEQEAQIIAEAGRPGAVTIATNMAGRGTDIKLGGNIDEGSEAQAEDVKLVTAKAREAGGLFVIGTERHESRRIDNQLRGRSGRQGDPGASKFFLCLEDDLLRIFGSQRLDAILVRLGMQEGEAITHRMVTRAIEKAQVRVEARNYDIRKQLLKYDNVMNDQRQVIYEQRRALMVSTNMAEEIAEMKEDLIEQIVARYVPEHALPDQWNLEGLHTACLQVFNLDLPIQTWSEEEGISEQDIKQRIYAAVEQIIQGKIDKYGYVVMQDVWQNLMLRILDQAWKEHLLGLDHLRQGINLRAYGQRDPLNEYKHEAFMLFKMLMAKVREGAITSLCHLELELSAGAAYDSDKILEDAPSKNLHFLGGNAADFAPVPSENVARNAPCPCGSGKKFKHCHGKI
jgi:preprotein translocase subunit SecA